MSKRSRAPKRRIERINSYIADQSSDTTIGSRILHVATKPETLVRMILDLHAMPNTSQTANNRWSAAVQIEPKGIAIAPLTVTEALDVSEPEEMLFRYSGMIRVLSAVGEVLGHRIFRDSKAMRKLTKGDEIVNSIISEVAGDVILSGNVTMWFKD